MNEKETFTIIIEFNCDNCDKRVTDLLGHVPLMELYKVKLMCSHCNTQFISSLRIIEDTSVDGNYRALSYGVRRVGNDPENPKGIVGEVIME